MTVPRNGVVSGSGVKMEIFSAGISVRNEDAKVGVHSSRIVRFEQINISTHVDVLLRYSWWRNCGSFDLVANGRETFVPNAA